ncbi:MAG: hypothetical protein BWY10_01521 [Chloroflexi bacterium ADurb.Bin180]|nr:MAG: hypothetical protein BWY10_01521 [Chloroflexi bacterium ADurb.Bin180]
MMGVDECRRLARLYNLERYLFDEVSARFRRDGTLSVADFYAIIVWKSNRTKTKIKKALKEAGLSADTLMSQVAGAQDDITRLQLLTNVRNIGLPIASAILTVCYPDRFTVLDSRAWQSAVAEGMPGLPDAFPETAPEYLQYRDACQAFAERVGLSLRDLDRALWARSWEKDLQELIADNPAEEKPVEEGIPTTEPKPAPEPKSKVKIHVAVYLVSRLLAGKKKTFTAKELIDRVRQEFDDWRPGVGSYVSSHAVANANKGTAVVYNYLWNISYGLYQCFDPKHHSPHPSREDAATEPDPGDVPLKYRYLLPANN